MKMECVQRLVKPERGAMKSFTGRKSWLKMFSQLLEFKEKHGHCLVPNRYEKNRSLGYWVSTQRHQYKLMKNNQASLMTPERMQLLESIGFAWVTRDPNHDPWETNFFKLLEYMKQHGNCHIETKKSKLGSWASTQRVEYKRYIQGAHSRMTEKKIKMLEMIGFNWESKRGAAAAKVRKEAKEMDSTQQLQSHEPSYHPHNLVHQRKLNTIHQHSVHSPVRFDEVSNKGFPRHNIYRNSMLIPEHHASNADIAYPRTRYSNFGDHCVNQKRNRILVMPNTLSVSNMKQLATDTIDLGKSTLKFHSQVDTKDDYSSVESAALGLLLFRKSLPPPSLKPTRVEPPKRHF